MSEQTVTLAKGALAAAPGTAFAWFADTLPVLQWFAAVGSLLIIGLTIYKAFSKK